MTSHSSNIIANVPVLQQPRSEEAFNVDPNAPFLGAVSQPSSADSTPPLTRQPSTSVRPSGKGFTHGFASMVRRAMSNKRRQQQQQQMAFPPPHDPYAQDPYPPNQQWPLNNTVPEADYTFVSQQSPPTSPGRASAHSRAASQHAPSLAPSQARSIKAPSIAQLQHSLQTIQSPPHPQHPGQPQTIHDLFYEPVLPLSPVAHSHRTHRTAASVPRVLSPTPSQTRSRHSRAASLQAPSHHSRMSTTPAPPAASTPGPSTVPPPQPTSPDPSQAHSHAASNGQAKSHRTRSGRSTVSSQMTVPPSGAATPIPPPDDDIDGTTAAEHQMQPVAPPPTQQQQQQSDPLPAPNIDIILAEPVYHSPELASDYAKMSSRASMQSVGSVLDRVKQFMREINELPWVAERVTIDYVPGSSRRRTAASVKGLGLRSSRGGRGSWYEDRSGVDLESGLYGEGKGYSIRPPHNRKKSGDKSLKKMSIDGSSTDGHTIYTRGPPTTAAHGHGPPAGNEYNHTHGLVTGAGGEAPVGPAGLSAATVDYLRTHRPTQYAGIMYVHDNPGYKGPPPPPTPRVPAPPPAAVVAPTQGTPATIHQATPGRPQGVQLHDPPVPRPADQSQSQPQSPAAGGNSGLATPLSALSPISTRSTQRHTATVAHGLDGLRTFPTGYVPAHQERDATARFGEGETHHRNPAPGVLP